MKSIFICLLFFCLKGYGQQLKDFRPPAGFKQVMKAEGDLDKDGVSETVYIYNTNKKSGDDGFFRVLYICKKQNGKMKVWKENHSVIWEYARYGRIFDEVPDLDMTIRNNTLVITQTCNSNSRHSQKYQNIFRYQNGDFYLIGSTHNDFDTCDFDFQYDINFSTKKVNIEYTYGTCDDDKTPPEDETLNFIYPFKQVLKMDGFTPGKTEVKIPGNKRYFYY